MALAVARPFRPLVPQALAAVLALLLLTAAAAAQQGAGAAGSGQASADGDGGAIPPGAVGASVEQLQGLVDTLQSDAERQRLVQQLEALIAAKRAQTQGQGQGAGAAGAESAPDGLGSRLLQGIGERLDAARAQLGEAVDTLERIPAAARDLWAGLQRAEVRQRWLDVALNLLLILGGAVLAERLAHLLLRAPRRRLARSGNGGLPMRTLLLLARRLAEDIDGTEPRDDFDEVLAALERLPDDLQYVLESSDARSVAHDYVDSEAYLFIGRHLGFPVAKEGALKFKEITYEHAESFTSGRLKHGPLALVTPSTPIFAIATGEERSKTLTNATEAKSRGAPIVLVTDDEETGAELADKRLTVPETHELLEGLLANVQLQLVSYYAANRLDREIDKPRNLAKSVTVE